MSNVVSLTIENIDYSMALPNSETDYIQGKIASERTPYEIGMLSDMASRLKPTDLVLDVGANVGNHTLYLAAVAQCQVVAFEPNQQLAQAIEISRELNCLKDQIQILPVGVGEAQARGQFTNLDASNLGAQSIELSSDPDAPLQVITLDSQSWDKPVRAIKVDVEGMELAVLKGGQKLIQKDQPIIYVECQTESDFICIHQWLFDQGYVYWDTFNATPTHLFLPANQVSSDQLQSHTLYQAVREQYRTVVQQNEQRKKWDVAAQKYRVASENIADLKHKLADANNKYRHAGEELVELKHKLTKANEKYKQTSQESVELKQQLVQMQFDQQHSETARASTLQAFENSEQTCQSLEEQLQVLNEQLARANDKCRKATEQSLQLKADLERAQFQHEASVELFALTQDKLVLTEQQMQQTQKQHQSDQQRLQQYLEQGQALSQTMREQLLQTEVQVEQLAQQKLLVKLELKQANDKYRQVTGEQIPKLKQQLADKTVIVSALQEKLQSLTVELNESENRRRAADKRVLDLRFGLTFKTGYLIREQSRSLAGLLKLPVGLWRIYKQSCKRAQQRLARKAIAAPVKKPAVPVEVPTEPFVTPQPLALSERAADLSELLLPTQGSEQQKKVACIMDDFTFNCYQPECQLQQLTPAEWEQELEAFQPELLFIESAWRGKDELWGNKVGHQSEEVKAIVRWCNAHRVPTIFWNKEDPVHFETFLNTAKLFDYIFTTDIDCIHRYKGALGHDRVYLLPFACQPAVHNPIEVYKRKDAFSFAGAYYVRYPHRTKDLEGFVENLPGFRPLEIYDRNYGKDNPDYQFPENYQPYIVGTLPFNEIDKAYKGYRYAINLNSIKQSQSMFARRVFELLASNTLTISNFSRGIRLFFGDLVLATDSGEQVVNRLNDLADTSEDEDKLRLIALRKVMQEHTYRDRLNYVLSKVTGQAQPDSLSEFAVFTPVDSIRALAGMIAQVQEQQAVSVTLHPLVSGALSASQAQQQLEQAGLSGQALILSNLQGQKLADLVPVDSWCCAFLPEDYYGPNYLLDFALASRYSLSQVVGKGAYYHYQQGEIELFNNEQRYRPVTELAMRASAISYTAAQEFHADSWYQALSDGMYQQPAQLAIDAFNYCRYGAAEAQQASESVVKAKVDDLEVNAGMEAKQLLSIAENIQPLAEQNREVKHYTPQYLAELIGLSGSKKVALSLTEEGVEIRSELLDGKHEYFYAQQDIPRDGLLQGVDKSDKFPLYFDLEPGLNVSLVILFLDASKQRISHQILRANANHTVELPLETRFVRLGIRVYAGGQAAIKEVLFDHKDLQPARLLGQSDSLLLTNHYASYSDLYRNGFVHSRVKSYMEQGSAVDIFRLRKNEVVSWHEFQGIDITTGSQEALRRLLASGQYRHVLVHFLDADMWQVLQEFIDQIKVTVWLHGAEVQPWWRRQFNYQDEEQLALAKLQSEKRMAFWHGLLSPMPENLQLVFVSNYLAQVVMDDLQLEIPEQQYQIIHNPINTDLFCYQKKTPEQRKKILSIRPYASRTYANDLSVQAILELAKEPWFSELDICLIGDGPLFEETLAPLKKFSNVTIEQRFLTQDEIAQYHKDYGLFLCPSRMDTQGVSRDEAMASSLVPVTNAVAAIPEFADDTCAILAPEENAVALAEGIKQLYGDPDRFLRMSEAASQRVRNKTSKDVILQREVSIFA